METAHEGLAALCVVSALIVKLEQNAILEPADRKSLVSFAQDLASSFPAPQGPAADQLLGEFGPLND